MTRGTARRPRETADGPPAGCQRRDHLDGRGDDDPAVALVAAAAGLVLALGLAQRRPSLAIVAALGASSAQQAAVARAEGAALAVLGGARGATCGWILAMVLVKVLTGVFDPPPAGLAVPRRYLAVVPAVGLASLAVAVAVQLRALRRPLGELVPDL